MKLFCSDFGKLFSHKPPFIYAIYLALFRVTLVTFGQTWTKMNPSILSLQKPRHKDSPSPTIDYSSHQISSQNSKARELQQRRTPASPSPLSPPLLLIIVAGLRFGVAIPAWGFKAEGDEIAIAQVPGLRPPPPPQGEEGPPPATRQARRAHLRRPGLVSAPNASLRSCRVIAALLVLPCGYAPKSDRACSSRSRDAAPCLCRGFSWPC